MSPGEKLFFKRNFAGPTPGGKPLYIKLFNAIASQKQYDEEAIIEKFKPVINKKNIASQKHYLHQQICEAVINIDNRKNEGYEIYKQILLIRIYRKKSMYKEAHTIWKKAVQKARAHESYAELNLLKTEFEKMIFLSSADTRLDDLHAIFKNNLINYAVYADLITLRDIYTEITLLKRKTHFDLDDKLLARLLELERLVNNINTDPGKKSFWFRHYHNMSKATLMYLQHNTRLSFTLLKEVWTDWKNNPDFITKHAEFYIELMYMINYAGILEGDYEFVLHTFSHPVNQLIKEPAQKANFEVVKFLALNKIYNKTARYDEVEKLMQVIKIDYKQWEQVLNADLKKTVNISIGIASFVLEQYNDALFYIKRGISYFREGTREEQTAVANILLLLTCYCINNSKLFDAQYRATYNYFYKRKIKQPFETALVQCLHRTFYMKDIKSKADEYHKALSVFERNKDNVIQQINFSIFNYYGWLVSRAERIPYRQYVERNVKKYGTVPAL
jgi:hypothetical protein